MYFTGVIFIIITTRMFDKKSLPVQHCLWIPTHEIVVPKTMGFYEQFNAILDKHSFTLEIHKLCSPYYSKSAEGKHGIDPVVYFKMLFVGFFENIGSERGISSRVEDSISIRTFLKYTLTEKTPEHSSLSVIRKRIPEEVHEQCFFLIVAAMKAEKLAKGRHIGMDSTSMEANASLKSLENKLTKEDYWDYVKRLAEAEGIDPNDGAAVRRFDKKRPDKKVSNKVWQNPHDPEAKVGKTKKGATAMIYKVEHVADMETGALLDVRIHPGDQGDQEGLCDKVLELEKKLDEALEREADSEPILSNTNDKGYYSVKGIMDSNAAGIRTVTSDPLDNRRIEKLSKEERKAVRNAIRAVKSKSGKELLKKRGMYLERSFAHTCNQGGARRTTLRGREKIQKRYFVVGAAFNLSLMLLKYLGVGTPKQWVARSNISIRNAFFVLFEYIRLKITKNDFIGSNQSTCVLARQFIY